MVGLDSLLSELPDGLETRIGNGARPLSGGQAQRIALARAFLDQNRRIMVFDEPTAHLDIETELELKEKMLPLMSDRLVIFANSSSSLVEPNGRYSRYGEGESCRSRLLSGIIS